MKRIIQVCLGEEARLVGELRYDLHGGRESAAFAYASEWLNAPERFAIDPNLPLVSGFQFHKRSGDGSLFHGAIADTEPDGWGRKVIARDQAKRRESARRTGIKSPPSILGALDYLLAVDDSTRLGALRFRDESGILQADGDDRQRRAPPLLELSQLVSASHAVEMSTETESDLAYLRGKGTSLGGLRPKCSVIDDDGYLAIGKFPSVSDQRAVTKGEVLALHLAKLCGIHAADGRLVDSDGLSVAIIRRFDRRSDGTRIPYCSAATMLGAENADVVHYTYTDIVDVIRMYGASAQDDIEELWRRIAFSISINNVDDHLHNHGFLYADHQHWRLAPAFDLNPFPDRARELKTWISEEAGPVASLQSLRDIAPYFRITKKRAEEMLEQIQDGVGRWREIGAQLGMTDSELNQFGDAFEVLT